MVCKDPGRRRLALTWLLSFSTFFNFPDFHLIWNFAYMDVSIRYAPSMIHGGAR